MRSAIASGALCLAIGLGIGAIFAGSGPTTTSFQVETAGAPTVTASDSVSRAELAAIVRREVAGALAAQPAGTVSAVAGEGGGAAEPPALEPEQAERADRAATIVRGAIARGAWSEADKAQLGASLEGLPGAVQAEITAELFDAMNRGAVRPDVDGFPL